MAQQQHEIWHEMKTIEDQAYRERMKWQSNGGVRKLGHIIMKAKMAKMKISNDSENRKKKRKMK
jgi:succinate dehydrogenase flavin-adding protein (antitoxin of CptAB toxin-antitoxin module)